MKTCSCCKQTFEVTPQTWYFRNGKPEGTRCRACLFEYYKLRGQQKVLDPVTGETVTRTALKHRELRRTDEGKAQANAYAAKCYAKQKAERPPKFIDLLREALQGPFPLQMGKTHACNCCGHSKTLDQFNKSLTGYCKACQRAYRALRPLVRRPKLGGGAPVVYKLYWPGAPEFYIGVSTDPYTRRASHITTPCSFAMHDAIARLGPPSMELLETVPEGVNALNRESHWIAKLDATNRNIGGLNSFK